MPQIFTVNGSFGAFSRMTGFAAQSEHLTTTLQTGLWQLGVEVFGVSAQRLENQQEAHAI